jgi:hypothetical protein
VLADAAAALLELLAQSARALAFTVLAIRAATTISAIMNNFAVTTQGATGPAVRALSHVDTLATRRPNVASLTCSAFDRRIWHGAFTGCPIVAAALPRLAAQKTSKLTLSHVQIGLRDDSAADGAVIAFFPDSFQVCDDALGAEQVTTGQLVQRTGLAFVERLQLAFAKVKHVRPHIANTCTRS